MLHVVERQTQKKNNYTIVHRVWQHVEGFGVKLELGVECMDVHATVGRESKREEKS